MRRRRHPQLGASSAEYALILSLLAIALIGAFLFFGGALDALFEENGTRVGNLP